MAYFYSCKNFPLILKDISKQLISSLSAHILNIFLALILENLVEEGDGCLWYLVNLTVDTTFGVFLCFIFISIIEMFALRNGIDVLRSGEYWP